MKLFTVFPLIFFLSLPVSAGKYCNDFKAGYRSVAKNLAIESICPEEAPIVFGQRNGVRGFIVGVKALRQILKWA